MCYRLGVITYRSYRQIISRQLITSALIISNCDRWADRINASRIEDVAAAQEGMSGVLATLDSEGAKLSAELAKVDKERGEDSLAANTQVERATSCLAEREGESERERAPSSLYRAGQGRQGARGRLACSHHPGGERASERDRARASGRERASESEGVCVCERESERAPSSLPSWPRLIRSGAKTRLQPTPRFSLSPSLPPSLPPSMCL